MIKKIFLSLIFALMLLSTVATVEATGNSFTSVWGTNLTGGTSNTTSISLPLYLGGTYNFNVTWGDDMSDVITAYNQAEVTHNYAIPGNYTINITGTLEGFRFANGGDDAKIIDIQNWGNVSLGNSNSYFMGCTNLNISAADAPNLSSMTTMYRMFYNADNLNANLSHWNTSTITTMADMFQSANGFNGDLSGWNTSSVTTMSNMFNGAIAFNGNVSGWDVSSVTIMSYMFQNADAFDQDLNNWDTSKVTTMYAMFYLADVFNGGIGNWDTSNVTSMRLMLYSVPLFDQDISRWNISKVAVNGFLTFIGSGAFSTKNYDKLLIEWSKLTPFDVGTFQAIGKTYTVGAPATARQVLIDTYGWAFSDGGSVSDVVAPDLVIISPTATTYNNLTQLLNLTSSDVNGNTTWYNWNGTNITFTSEINITYVEGSNTLTAWSNDTYGNVNTTSVTFSAITLAAPFVNSISFTPNSTANQDIGTVISVSSNITDAYFTIDVVKLQWKASNESTYTNVTMAYNATSLLYDSASFIPLFNETYNVTIWANNSFSNVNTSTSNLLVENDTTWESPATIPNVFGQQNQVKSVGLIYINNTGDDVLTITSLTSNFGLTFNETPPFNISAKETRYVNATGTYSSSVRADDIVVSMGAEILSGLPTSSQIASPTNSTINFTMNTISPGPYLSTIISGDSVISQSGTKAYIGYTENVGNESVINASLNWTIPTGSSLSAGSLSTTTTSLAASSKLYNNITLIYGTNIPYDPNATTQLILNGTSDSNTSSVATLNLTVLCNGGDGVCGNSCTVASDADCGSGSSSSSSGGGGSGGSSGGGGGGGGGGGFLNSRTVFKTQTNKEVTLVRGKSNEFKLDISNIQEGSVIKDTTVEVTGFLSKYIKVTPSRLTDIGFGQTKYFTVEINAPNYLEESDYALEALIQSSVLMNGQIGTVTDKRIISLFIKEESGTDIDFAILSAENAIEEMKQKGIPTTLSEVLLEKARSAYSKGKFKLASEFAENIISNKEKGFLVLEGLSEFEDKIADAHDKGLDVSSTEQLFNVAKDAFEVESFDIALQSLNQAQLTYILEIKKELNLLRFATNYWWAIILGLMLLLSVSYFYYTQIIIALANYKIKNLTKEGEVVHELLKKNQAKYYEERSISSHEFSKNQTGYEHRLSEIQQLKTKLRTQRVGFILSNRKEMKKVLKEKSMVIENLKNLQTKYYKSRAITRSEFDGSNKVIKTRLVELEEDEAILEAKIGAEKQNRKGKFKHSIEDGLDSVSKFFKNLKDMVNGIKKKTKKYPKPERESDKTNNKGNESGKFSDFRDEKTGFTGQIQSGILNEETNENIFGNELTKKRIDDGNEKRKRIAQDKKLKDDEIKDANMGGAYDILRDHGVNLGGDVEDKKQSTLSKALEDSINFVRSIRINLPSKKVIVKPTLEEEEAEIKRLVEKDLEKNHKRVVVEPKVNEEIGYGAYEILRNHGVNFDRKEKPKIDINKRSIVGGKKEGIVEGFRSTFVKRAKSYEPKKELSRIERWKKERNSREMGLVDKKRKNNEHLEEVKGVLDEMGIDYNDKEGPNK